MFCPKCGKINPDNAEICSGCDAILKESKAAVTTKKKNTWKIILAVILVILIVLIAVFLLSGCGNTNVNPNEKVMF